MVNLANLYKETEIGKKLFGYLNLQESEKNKKLKRILVMKKIQEDFGNMFMRKKSKVIACGRTIEKIS